MFLKKSFLLVSLLAALLSLSSCTDSQLTIKSQLSEIGPGWSKTSVNATIFRKNSIVSDNGNQLVAYYDSTGRVVLAKRQLGSNNWTLHPTQYKGNVYDAHNIISIMIDGDGYLHMSWDHHNNRLNYCKSLQPYGTEMGEKEAMIGTEESVVSYPEFYRFGNGDLLFAYRDGGSGNGNLVLNRYDLVTGQWKRLQTNLIDGEGKRNAYWQLHIDKSDRIMVSWVWRESPDVASNHDMCYAVSNDGGFTWMNSKEQQYALPINQANAEVVWEIPQNSNLINQTSISSDEQGNAYIATYYKAPGENCTQFHLIYQNKGEWLHSTVTQRTQDFPLGGMGSRSIPISRPQLVISKGGKSSCIHVIYRDEEQNNRACISSAETGSMEWSMKVLSQESLGRWEPSIDSRLWEEAQQLHLYHQNVGQGQGETAVQLPPQTVAVLEVNIKR